MPMHFTFTLLEKVTHQLFLNHCIFKEQSFYISNSSTQIYYQLQYSLILTTYYIHNCSTCYKMEEIMHGLQYNVKHTDTAYEQTQIYRKSSKDTHIN